jgi:hypothetical protein
MKGHSDDPKGLIHESFRIDGISKSECRTIFLDWALSLPLGADTGTIIRRLLERHAAEPSDHPMLDVLREGLDTLNAPRRRGGWRSRPRH